MKHVLGTRMHVCSAEFGQGELFEILEDDKRLPEDVVRSIAKQLVRRGAGRGAGDTVVVKGGRGA